MLRAILELPATSVIQMSVSAFYGKSEESQMPTNSPVGTGHQTFPCGKLLDLIAVAVRGESSFHPDMSRSFYSPCVALYLRHVDT